MRCMTQQSFYQTLEFIFIPEYCAATNDELHAAANAIAQLQSRPLSGIRTVATGDLADAS